MKFAATVLEGSGDAFLIRPTKFADLRGYFVETWSKAVFADLGIDADFVQDNESLSVRKWTLRGLHYQQAPAEQAKLVRVLKGAIYDVIVDIRPTSGNFGKWFGIELSFEQGDQLYIPRGYAHGFVTLVEGTVVSYKVDAPYSREREAGIRWNDPALDIRWPLDGNEAVLSEKDTILPLFEQRA